MNTMFPFGLPATSAWYAELLIVTLLMHMVFMQYVLAGMIVMTVTSWRGATPVTRVLRDWMPAMLSAAITAGVAPLLFVQILYQREFYTANLLSFHRWMAILPVLIVAFYALYLLKSKRLVHARTLSAIVATLTMACVLFVAWSWVENHLLSLDRGAWTAQYLSEAMLYREEAIMPRLAFWVVVAFPAMCLIVTWQMRRGASGVDADEAARSTRLLAIVALIALPIAAAIAWWSLGIGPAGAAQALESGAVRPHLAIAAIGAVMQAIAWVLLRSGATGARIALAFIGLVVTLFGMLSIREAVRWASLDGAALAQRHAEVGTSAGLVVFIVFSVIAVAVAVWVMRIVSTALRTKPVQ